MSTPHNDARSTQRLRSTLLAFYDARRRDLPWRRTRDPYEIWVSEVMLQQTRVETVIPYWERWLVRFPTINALARAPQEEVLEAWTGLGYYSRARNLHRAAQVVRESHSSQVPETYAELQALPGVGAYTAGALASIAFGQAVPAVDGNVRRVLSRLDDVATYGAAQLAERAGELVDPQRPGDFNQALMELGALVCTPRNPACDSCPWNAACRARINATVAERPARRRRKPTPEAAFAVAVCEADRGGGQVLVAKRPSTGLLAGMWEFPAAQIELGATPDTIDQAARGRLLELLGLGVTGIAQPLPAVAHRFSHLSVVYHPVLLRVASAVVPVEHPKGDKSIKWVSWAALGSMALPVAQQRISREAQGR